MTKIRVYQLAKELGIENAELIERLKVLHFDVKNHMSTLSDGEADRIRAEYHRERLVKVDEKRIKPTVIRRRKLDVEKAPEEIRVPEPPHARESESEKAPMGEEEQPEAAWAHGPQEGVRVQVPPVAEQEVPSGLAGAEARVKKAGTPVVDRVGGAPSVKSPAEQADATTQQYVGAAQEGAGHEQGDKVGAKDDKGKRLLTLLKRTEEEDEEQPVKKGKPHAGKKVVYPLDRSSMLEIRTRQLTDAEGYLGRRGRLSREELEFRRRRMAAKRPALKPVITTPKPIKRKIRMGSEITIAELAKRLSVKAAEVIKKLMAMGVMVSINQPIDFDTAVIVANEFGYEVEAIKREEADLIVDIEDRPEALEERPPVVTIMGHVNHGKTRLLDAIRKSNIVETEAGGITQHIGAYRVSIKDRTIVFIDTPGHEAFTKMRARGAKITDIVVLVVAADDGVMPQTIEAINHAKAAEVPIIVAINKIDLTDANAERVKQSLAEYGLLAENWGGETLYAEISAKQGIGIQELLEFILLQAEMMELKANPQKRAKGVIIEAKLDRTLGPVATVLVQEGTLQVGDPFIAGLHSGKVRALMDDRGERLPSAGPSIPVEVLGASGVPEAGDTFIVVEEERKARLLGSLRLEKAKAAVRVSGGRMTLEELYEKIKEDKVKELNVILKADVQGSAEALSEALVRLSGDEVKIRVIHSGVGGITETDIMLASASDAIVLGFNVRAEIKAMQLSEQEEVDIRFYTVIYDAVSDIQRAMEGMLAPRYKELFLGRAEVRELFHVPRVGTVAGSYVVEGKMERNAKVRVLRDNVVVYEGKLASLRRFKDDVRDVMAGYECGIGIENYNDLKVGDIFESYYLEQITPHRKEGGPAEKSPE